MSSEFPSIQVAGPKVIDVRTAFKSLYRDHLQLCTDETVCNHMLEVTGVSFVADEDHIFGKVNHEYIARELSWYYSQSLSVYDIPGGPPKIWEKVADAHGQINSNYGYLMFSDGNGRQFDNVMLTLQKDLNSRQAVAVYTRPTVHDDAWHNGRSDFICTNTVQYLHRNGELHAVVNMRSNDAIFGYRNDYAWQKHLLDEIAHNLGVVAGQITWQVGSLHIYPRHMHLVQSFIETGVHDGSL